MKKLMTTLLFVLLYGTGLCFAEGGVTVSGTVTFENPYSPGQIVEGSASGTVKLLQNGSEIRTGNVTSEHNNALGKSISSYTIENVETGTYTLQFLGEGYGKVLVYETASLEVSTEDVTHDFRATVDDTRGYTTIIVHYGENYQDYGGGYGSWETDIRLENAKVTLTPAEGEAMVATSDLQGGVKFPVAKNADLTYTLTIEPHGEMYKDTTIASFVAYGDNGHGNSDFKTLNVYVQKIPLPTVTVSGKVQLDGQLLKSLPVEDMAIGIKTVEGKKVTAPISNGQYTFENVPVADKAITTFYLYDPNPGAKYDGTLGVNVPHNFVISSPENGGVELTLSETGFTQDIEIKRIAVNITGTITGIKDGASVHLKQGETTIARVSSNMVGAYKFQGVQPGIYTVVVDKYGYNQKNTPTVAVASIADGDVKAESIAMEPKDIETTISCTGLYGYNQYTESSTYLKGATVTLWACEDGAATGEAPLQTVTSEGDYASFSFAKLTTKYGTTYVVKVSHPDIEDIETMVSITGESTSVYISGLVFKYNGPELLGAENFQYTWNATKDTLLLSWRWPEALRDQENYKVEMVRLSRKLSSAPGMSTLLTYWNAPYDQTTNESVFAFDALPVAFKDSTAVNGYSYTYLFEIRYKKPYSARFETTFEVDLRILSRLTYEVNDPVMGRIVNKTTIEASDGNLYRQGDQIHLLAVANDGFRFVHWLNNGAVVEQETQKTDSSLISFYMPGKDVTYKAVFRKSRFVITLNATPENAGTVSGGGTYEGDANVTVKAVAHNGYQFKAWMEGDEEVSTKAEYTFQPEDDRSLTAVFIETQYVLGLGVNNPAWGTVEGSGEFAGGTEVTVKATPAEGYKFVAWQEDDKDVSTEATYSFKIERDMMLTAVFEDATQRYAVTLNVNEAEWGKAEGAGEFAEGSTVTVKATPNENYHFVAWMEGDKEVATTAVYTFTVEKDITLTAVFAEGSANEELEAARWSVYAENGTLVIIGLNGDRYSVYDLNGRLSGQARCTGAEIRMDVAPNRLYIVRRISAAGQFGAKKIVVR